MKYEPIKQFLGTLFNRQPVLRIAFYKLMNLLLLRTWHVKKVIRSWSKKQGENAHILDAGAGFGQYSYFISSLSKNYKITGIDILSEQIQDCNAFFSKINRNDRVQFYEYDITQFQNPDTYNLIAAVEVREHIEDDVKVFRNFCQSLQKDGMLVISTPSDQGGSEVHDNDDESFIAEHVRPGYNKEELEHKLKTAGFHNITIYYSYGKPGKLAWKLSMKYPIIMLNKSKLFFLILPFYYIFTYPVAYILNHRDVQSNHRTGTGLIAIAYK